MITGAPSLARFVLRTLAWLPPCFAAWYLGAQIHTGIAAALARLVVAFFNAAIIKATEYPGLELRFVTTIEVPSAAGRGVLAIEVNPLLYTYGLALFLALMLAARARWRHVLLGAAILLPFQGWGIGFDLLAHLGVKLGPEVSAQAGLLGSREFIALAERGTLDVRFGGGHEKRRGQALARDIGHDEEKAARIHHEAVVEIAAHGTRGLEQGSERKALVQRQYLIGIR